jgi:hypothetical protein
MKSEFSARYFQAARLAEARKRDKEHALYGICLACLAEGYGSFIATEYHHIVPRYLKKGWDVRNLVATCRYHHEKLGRRPGFWISLMVKFGIYSREDYNEEPWRKYLKEGSYERHVESV